jgi:5-methylcytosine-specific restriction endonuclease McrA
MFSVDHLWPRTTHPERLCDYDNLVYACCQCNALKEEARALLRGLQGFPDNLPRLATLRPPNGNTRPEASSDSYDAKRQRGELPVTY